MTTPCIRLEIHWLKEAVVPSMWEVGNKEFMVVKFGFDVYAGIPVYIVEEKITIRLVNNCLVIGEQHFKEQVECQK